MSNERLASRACKGKEVYEDQILVGDGYCSSAYWDLADRQTGAGESAAAGWRAADYGQQRGERQTNCGVGWAEAGHLRTRLQPGWQNAGGGQHRLDYHPVGHRLAQTDRAAAGSHGADWGHRLHRRWGDAVFVQL